MDFITGLPILIDWKKNSYNSILVIINWLIKMVYYKLLKITLDASGLATVIINVVICQHDFLDLIITNRGLLFTSKFWSSLCYFFDIKRRLSTTFHLQTDGQIE